MREPKDVHPLLEHTPTNHLIQFVDAPIRECFYYLLFEMPDDAFLNDVRAGKKVFFLCFNNQWTFHAYDKKNQKVKNIVFSDNPLPHLKTIISYNDNYQPKNKIKDFESVSRNVLNKCMATLAPIAKKYQSKHQSKKIAIQDADKTELESVITKLEEDRNIKITKEEEAPKESVKILACNTQHPHSFKDGTQLENEATSFVRFEQLIDIIKKVEENKKDDKTPANAANPDIYTFLAVHPKMLERIKKHFDSNKYHIIKQEYGEGVVDAFLITILKKSVVKSANPLASGLYQKRVQSLLCTLTNTKKQFVLHLTHLPHRGNNVDQATHIDQTERGIINTIFSNAAFASYPQILTGDLNITLKEGSDFSRNIATSVTPAHIIDSGPKGFNNKSMPSWNRTMGTLTIPALKPNKTSAPVQLSLYQAIQKIELESHEAIDPETGYRPTTHPRIYGDNIESHLFSRFGKHYRTSLKKRLESTPDTMIGNKYYKKVLYQEMSGVQLYIRINQNNVVKNYVYHISKKIWIKLKLLLDWDKLNKALDKNTPQHEHLTGIFLIFKGSYGDEIPEAIARLYSKEYQNALTLEEAVKEHCSCEWIKENDVIYIQFSFNHGNQLIAKNLAEKIHSGKIIDNDKFRLPIKDIPQDMEETLQYLIKVARNIEETENKCCGLVTFNFDYSSKKLFFFTNEELRSVIRPILEDIIPSERRNIFGWDDKCCHISYENFFDEFWEPESTTKFTTIMPMADPPKLSTLLVTTITELLKTIPYGIHLHQDDTNLITTSKKALPHILIQHFELIQLKKHLYTTSNEKKCSRNIVTSLYKDYVKWATNILNKFKDYSGKDKAYQELKILVNEIAKINHPNPLEKVSLVNSRCEQEIEISENAKKNQWIFLSAPKTNKHTDLLHKTLLQANFIANFEFSFRIKSKIETPKQLINTQEKRELFELCVKERQQNSENSYSNFRKNAALLLLEHHLILSHPGYTAKEVWEHIKTQPVENYGTGKNYPCESGDGEMTLKDILKLVKQIWKSLSSLVTSNNAEMNAQEKLQK